MADIFQTIGNVVKTAAGVVQNPTTYVPPGITSGSVGDPQAGVDYPNYTPIPVAAGSPVKGTSVDSLTPGTFTASSQSGGKLKYNVKSLTYPSKVSGAADLQHYVVFFINIRGKSKFKDSYGSKAAIASSNNLAGLDANNLVNAGAGALGFAGGIAIASTVLANVKPTRVAGKLLKLAGIGGYGVAGYQGAKAANNAAGLFVPDQTFRIDQAIMLAVNEKPSVTYGINYEGKELGTLIGWLAGGVSAADAVKKSGENVELVRAAAMAAAKITLGIADALNFKLNPGDAKSIGTGTTPNPFREQVFKNVQTREFLFNYKFLPRSQTEFDNVQKIIYQFKFHMHPELSSGKLFYIYPSTFDVVYYYRGKVNGGVHRIATCVLEHLSVDYGGQGFNTFNNGGSTEIDIKLQFRELEVMTKDRIKEGY